MSVISYFLTRLLNCDLLICIYLIDIFKGISSEMYKNLTFKYQIMIKKGRMSFHRMQEVMLQPPCKTFNDGEHVAILKTNLNKKAKSHFGYLWYYGKMHVNV